MFCFLSSQPLVCCSQMMVLPYYAVRAREVRGRREVGKCFGRMRMLDRVLGVEVVVVVGVFWIFGLVGRFCWC